ncbi:MAG: DUF2442 domain-containing protein [Bacteroidia bacterium]
MRTLTDIKANSNYSLTCTFDNGNKKTVSLVKLLDLPVFRILKDINSFTKVTNKKYFVEWEGLEIDLSADTLYLM